jgi:adenylate kinase
VHRLVFRLPEMDEQPARIVIVVLGRPRRWQGNQSSMLASLWRIPHISVGSILRLYARDESEIGACLTRTMTLGNLAPDALVLDVLAARMSERDCARGLILDGFPGTLN